MNDEIPLPDDATSELLAKTALPPAECESGSWLDVVSACVDVLSIFG